MIARSLIISLALSLLGSSTLYGQSASIGASFETHSRTSVSNISGFIVVPPDTMGAIGPNHWGQISNGGQVSFYNKAGTATYNQSDEFFWNTTVGVAEAPAGDSRMLFDPLSGRWFALAFTGEATNNKILMARSNTANPNDGWQGGVITQTTGLFADYPTLGIDKNGVYIGTNNFGASFSSVSMFSLNKNEFINNPGNVNSAAITTKFLQQSADARGFTLQGVVNSNLGQSANAPGHFLAVDNELFSRLNWTPVNNVAGPGAATLGTTADINVATTSFPATAWQPNAANSTSSGTFLDTIDDRIQSNVVQVGNLVYKASSVGSGGFAAIRVTVLDVSTSTPTVVAESTLGGAGDPNFDLYIPSIAVNANGDIVVGYTRSGFINAGNADNRYPSSYATIGKLTGSTLTFGSAIELKRGETEYIGQDFEGGNPVRWGDYSATILDPSDPGIFWTTQQYAKGTAGVATREWAIWTSELMPVVAGEKRWSSISSSNAAGITGAFSNAANWYGGAAPSSADHVIFSRNGDGTTPYTVTMPAGTTQLDRASVRQGNVVFDITTGTTVDLTNSATGTPSLAVAEYLGTANLTVSGGGTLKSVNTTIGAGLNSEGEAASLNGNTGNVSNGSLTITGAGTKWENSGNVYVSGSSTAAGGLGSLSVTGGAEATITGELKLWRANSSNAVVTVGSASTGGTLNVGQLTNVNGAPVVNLANAASALRLTGSTDYTFTGVISGSGTFENLGASKITLTGDNAFTGQTTITNGTLELGAANALAGTSTVRLNGGKLRTGAGVGVNYTTGALQLAASSTLELSTDAHTITFNGITGTPTGTLSITNWTGTGGQSGTAGQVRFSNVGNDPNATFTSFLNTVAFSGYGAGALFISTSTAGVYELTPVPEPATVLGISAAALGLGGLLRRRKRRENLVTA